MDEPLFHVYLLQSENNPNRFHIGFTEDIEQRIAYHNKGKNPHPAKFVPWQVKTYVAFTNRE